MFIPISPLGIGGNWRHFTKKSSAALPDRQSATLQERGSTA